MPFTKIKSSQIYFEDSGSGGTPIVFLHGLLLDSSSFAAQRAAFSAQYRIICPDLPGQGRSAGSSRLDLESVTEDLAALIERIVGGPVHLVGFSMGAFIAMRLAARHPHLVTTLTLIGPSARPESRWKLPLYRSLMTGVRLFGVRPFAGALMRILFGQSYLNDPHRAIQRQHWRKKLAILPRTLRHAAQGSAHRHGMELELHAIQAPTLVMSGLEDRPIPARLHQEVQKTIPGAGLHVFPRTGHAIMLERPAEFNAVLAQFLTQHPSPPREPAHD